MPERHIYKNKLQQIDEVNHSPLTPLWKVLLIELISRQNTQAGSENGGLSWPGLDQLGACVKCCGKYLPGHVLIRPLLQSPLSVGARPGCCP